MFHVFPLLAVVGCQLQVFSCLALVVCFPALGGGCTFFGSSTHVTLKACSMRVYTLVISRRVEHVYISFVLLYNFCLTIFFYLESLEERFFGQDYCCTHECFYKPPECFTNLRILSSVSGRICHSCDCLFLWSPCNKVRGISHHSKTTLSQQSRQRIRGGGVGGGTVGLSSVGW